MMTPFLTLLVPDVVSMTTARTTNDNKVVIVTIFWSQGPSTSPCSSGATSLEDMERIIGNTNVMPRAATGAETMMTSWHGNALRITGLLWRESTGLPVDSLTKG